MFVLSVRTHFYPDLLLDSFSVCIHLLTNTTQKISQKYQNLVSKKINGEWTIPRSISDNINTLKKHVVTNNDKRSLPYYYDKFYRGDFVKVISIFGDFIFSEDQNKIIEE